MNEKYTLTNANDTYAKNGVIEKANFFYSCHGYGSGGESFHFLTKTLRGAKIAFSLEYKNKVAPKWERVVADAGMTIDSQKEIDNILKGDKGGKN